MEWSDDALDRRGVTAAIQWSVWRAKIVDLFEDRELARRVAGSRKRAKAWRRLKEIVEILPSLPAYPDFTDAQLDRFLKDVGIDWVAWDRSDWKQREHLLDEAQERVGEESYNGALCRATGIDDSVRATVHTAALAHEATFETRRARKLMKEARQCLRGVRGGVLVQLIQGLDALQVRDEPIASRLYRMIRDPVPAARRFAVLRRDCYTCQYCGRTAPDVQLQVDHRIPVSKGGTNEITNLVTACADCNLGKSNRFTT